MPGLTSWVKKENNNNKNNNTLIGYKVVTPEDNVEPSYLSDKFISKHAPHQP